RLHSQSHAGRCTCTDDISREQRHKFAYIRNQGSDVEDHVAGGTVLSNFAIHLQPHRQIARVGNLVRSHEEGSNWSKRICTFAFDPLTAAFQLKASFGVVIVQDESGDVFMSAIWC